MNKNKSSCLWTLCPPGSLERHPIGGRHRRQGCNRTEQITECCEMSAPSASLSLTHKAHKPCWVVSAWKQGKHSRVQQDVTASGKLANSLLIQRVKHGLHGQWMSHNEACLWFLSCGQSHSALESVFSQCPVKYLTPRGMDILGEILINNTLQNYEKYVIFRVCTKQ